MIELMVKIEGVADGWQVEQIISHLFAACFSCEARRYIRHRR